MLLLWFFIPRLLKEAAIAIDDVEIKAAGVRVGGASASLVGAGMLIAGDKKNWICFTVYSR